MSCVPYTHTKKTYLGEFTRIEMNLILMCILSGKYGSVITTKSPKKVRAHSCETCKYATQIRNSNRAEDWTAFIYLLLLINTEWFNTNTEMKLWCELGVKTLLFSHAFGSAATWSHRSQWVDAIAVKSKKAELLFVNELRLCVVNAAPFESSCWRFKARIHSSIYNECQSWYFCA